MKKQIIKTKKILHQVKDISRWNMIVWVSVVLKRTVVDCDWHFDYLCGSNLESQSDLYDMSWWLINIKVWLLTWLAY